MPVTLKQRIMKAHHYIIGLLVMILSLTLVFLTGAQREQHRLEENYAALATQNLSLRSSLSERELSVARLRMTIGELEELRREDAERIRSLGVRLRHAKSLTLLETIQRLDTVIVTAPEHSPLLSDSLCRIRWQDSWVSLAAEVRPTESHITLTTTDTLFQVVRRVPWRWWIFSWGTKAIRQEIRSSNPHTQLIYAEYIEIER